MVITLKMLQIIIEKEIEGSTMPLIVITGKPVNKLYGGTNVAHKDPAVSDHPVYMEVSNWTTNVSTYTYVILSHLRSKEPPGLHFICSPASQTNCKI